MPTNAAARLPQRPCKARAAPMRIALYQPHLVGPAGFPASDRAFRRAGMDYLDAVVIVRHRSWRDFESWRSGTEGHRLVLFTTTGAFSYLDYRYRGDDTLLFGRESAGVPPEVHAAADARLVIPMRPGLRSLNVAVAAAMAAGEALRQTGGTTSAAADRESNGDKGEPPAA